MTAHVIMREVNRNEELAIISHNEENIPWLIDVHTEKSFLNIMLHLMDHMTRDGQGGLSRHITGI